MWYAIGWAAVITSLLLDLNEDKSMWDKSLVRFTSQLFLGMADLSWMTANAGDLPWMIVFAVIAAVILSAAFQTAPDVKWRRKRRPLR